LTPSLRLTVKYCRQGIGFRGSQSPVNRPELPRLRHDWTSPSRLTRYPGNPSICRNRSSITRYLCVTDGFPLDDTIVIVRNAEEIATALLNKIMEYDITMSQPTCGICGDQDNGIYICETCLGEFCGCCIGRCEGCGDLVCAECGDPGPPFDPGCLTCIRSLTTGDG
jgi:hypothetical protein